MGDKGPKDKMKKQKQHNQIKNEHQKHKQENAQRQHKDAGAPVSGTPTQTPKAS